MAPSSSRCTNTPVDEAPVDMEETDPIMKMFEEEEAEMQALVQANPQ